MLLIKLLIALIALHVGMGIASLSLTYFTTDVRPSGAMGILSETPLRSLFRKELQTAQQEQTGGGFNLTDPRGMLEPVYRIGDTINGLATFRYRFLEMIGPEDGVPYNIVVILRLIGALFTLALGLAFLKLLFDSGALTSKLAMALLVGISAVSAVGLLFGG